MPDERKLLTKTLFTRARLWDFQTYLWLLPNPDPVLRKKGLAIQAYENILVDGRVEACMESRKSGVLSWEWELEGGGSDKNREILSDHLESLDIHGVLNQVMDAVFFGYKPLEVIWGRVGGWILPVEVRGLPPQWFAFDPENRLRFLSASSPMTGEEVPERKVLVAARDASYANPYGRPVAALCFWPVTFKRGGWRFWVSFVERFGMPHLLGKVPPGTHEDKMNALADKLEKMVQDAVAVIEDDQSIDTLDVGTRSASSDLYRDLSRHMNDEIAVAVLGQTLTTEVREGSRAAAQVHMAVREDIAAKDRRMVAGVMNRLIRWTWDLNFTGDPPVWRWVEEDDPKKEWAERDDLLAKQVRFTKVYFQRRYGLQDDEFQVMDTQGLPQAPEGFQRRSGGVSWAFRSGPVPAMAPPPTQDPGQAAIDGLADAYSVRAAEEFQKSLGPVLKAVTEASSYEDLMERLYELHQEMDTADFQELVRRALFAADLWGYLRARDEAGGA